MTTKTFIDDMLTLGSGFLQNVAESRHELKAQARAKAGAAARHFDLVTREEFDAAFAMLAKARSVQEDMQARVARIEACLKLPSSSTLVKGDKRNSSSVKTKTARRAKK